MTTKVCAYCDEPLGPRKRKFCCNEHKDKYHNTHNPRGYGLVSTRRRVEEDTREAARFDESRFDEDYYWGDGTRNFE